MDIQSQRQITPEHEVDYGAYNLFSFCRVLALGSLVLLTACSAGVDELRRTTDAQFTELRGIQAEHTAQLSELRTEIRTLQGKIEEMQFVSQGKAQELERTIQQLGSRVPPPSGVPEALLNRDDDRIAGIQGEAAELYRSALVRLRAGDFQAARQQFTDFVSANPGTAFTDNALFWLGITLNKMGQKDQAIVAFSDLLQSYPAEDMVAPALFHLAEIFAATGSREDAILAYERLVDEHKASEFAAEARKRLQQLQRSGRRR